MELCLLRAARSIGTSSAFALILSGTLGMSAPQAGTQQPAGQAGQQTTGQKNYKDRGEYDLYSKITQTQDPKARLQLLNTWQDKYPQSDFAQDRLQYFVATLGQLAPSDQSVRQQLLDKCNQLLKMDPKNFTANYFISLWGPAVGGTNPPPDLLSSTEAAAHAAIDNADAAFPPNKKPANMSEADWAKAKNQVLAIAHNALAWVATSKKDTATAENEYKASLMANPDQGRVSYLYAKMLQDDKSVPDEKKYPTVLFEYARAAEYTGPESVPANAQPQIMDYFKKVYTQFHGNADGEDQLLAQAKTNALPPDGFNITSAAAIANQQAEQINTRLGSDPAFKIWYAIKQSLQDKGDAFFNSDVKDAEIPGGAEGVKDFTGTVISLDPPDKPTKVVLGVEDPTKPDATLTFSQPLPPEALDTIKVGNKIQFSGVADSYTKDPYMLTFKDPSIPGVKTTAPPKRGTVRRRRG